MSYDGILLPLHYRVDFICFESVLVEVKALATLGSREVAQVMNYLRASGLHRALLLNFGADRLEKRRLVWALPESDDPVKRRAATQTTPDSRTVGDGRQGEAL